MGVARYLGLNESETEYFILLVEHLGIEQSHVSRILEFLHSKNLCIRESNHFIPGPQMTHLEAAPSPSERLYCLNIDWFEVK